MQIGRNCHTDKQLNQLHLGPQNCYQLQNVMNINIFSIPTHIQKALKIHVIIEMICSFVSYINPNLQLKLYKIEWNRSGNGFLCWHLLLQATYLRKKRTEPQGLASSCCLCSSTTDFFWMFFLLEILFCSVCSINRLHATFKMKNPYKHAQGIVVNLQIDKN